MQSDKQLIDGSSDDGANMGTEYRDPEGVLPKTVAARG